VQTRSKSAVVVAVLLFYGIYPTWLGLVMLVAPGFFFDRRCAVVKRAAPAAGLNRSGGSTGRAIASSTA